MANLAFNGWMKNVRGASGDIVFKHAFGKLVVAQKPKFPPGPPTLAQAQVRERFKASARYAKAVLADPVARQPYVEAAKARNTSAFALALGDYMNLPKVTEIDLAGYAGRVGDPIKVTATDDFELTSVKVTIRHATGTVLEQGLATANFEGIYVYPATTVAPTDEMLTIEAEATDRPGRQRTLSETWHA